MSDLAALVVQQSLNGVYLGCLYVMVALGLTLIYGVLNQINFAHADFVTVGAFTAFFVASRFATKVLGLPDTAGYLLSIVAAFGMLALFGPVPYQFDTPFARETFRIGRIFFSAQSVLVIVVSALAIGTLYAFLR